MLHPNQSVRRKLAILLLICGISMLFLSPLTGLAQQNVSYIFHRITQSDGLLHTGVRSIVQDSKGYIWILTPNGLQRYDGSRFVDYPYDVTSRGGIIDTRTASLFSDQKNNCLWIIDKEVEKLDLRQNRFELFTRSQMKKSSSFRFQSFKDSLNNEWLVGNFGVLTDHPFPSMFTFYLSASWLSPNNTSVFFTDTLTRDTWMVDYWYGLMLFDHKTKKLYTHDYNPLHHPLLQMMDKPFLTGIMQDSEKNIWISTNTPQFYRYDIASQKLHSYLLKDMNPLKKSDVQNHTLFVENFFEDNHHTIWLSTANAGLLKYEREKDVFIPVADEEKGQNGLYYSYDIRCIFQDRDENIWLGTDKGISIFNPYRQRFKLARHEENNPLSLPKEEVQSFIQARNGDILVGTWGGGISIYDSSWNFKKNIRLDGRFEYNLVWSFVENDDGTIWTGCQHGYIHVYDPIDGTIRTMHPPELNNFTIHCMTKDKQGNIWFGLHNGRIAEWNRSQNKFYGYNEEERQLKQAFAPVGNIFFDNRQRCWVSTESGLKQFDTEKRVFSAVYEPDRKDPASISAAIVQGIEQYDDSTLIIGTLHGGINLFSIGSKSFSRIATSGELSSNTVSAIKKDGRNDFWLTTDYGVFKFIPSSQTFVRYAIETGIINSPFKSFNFYVLKDGEWLAATTTELIRFDPRKMNERNVQTNKVEITGLRIFDRPVFIDSVLSANSDLHLSYKENFLTIEFSLLHFSNQQVEYSYRLSGVNSDWVNANAKQFASYTNLEPGNYVFWVRAENGGENLATTSFRIVITPPFWKTWWFIALVVIAVGLSIFFLVRRRIQAIKREAELKQKLAETEMMALRSQMNPHFIFNCLNAIDNLIQTNQPDKATTYLARFAKLIRYLLESSKNNLVPFSKDFETLQLYLQLEQFRSSNKFTYELNADKELMQGDYKVPPLVIQPFVENAIQHGLLNKQEGERQLIVNASLKNNYISYTISDNGVGRMKAMEIKNLNKPGHKSYGINISSERIHLHNRNGQNSVSIQDIGSGAETGTLVEVKLKV